MSSDKKEIKTETKVEQKKKEIQKDPQVLKMLQEDEDDFEQFEQNTYDRHVPDKIQAKMWRQDWDDEDINDDFRIQLKKQLGLA